VDTERLSDSLAETTELLARRVDGLADKIITRLSASVIPSSFPAYVGAMIREACKFGQVHGNYVIPLRGPLAIRAMYYFSPDGTFQIELSDINGSPFWRGTFRPEEEAANAHA